MQEKICLGEEVNLGRYLLMRRNRKVAMYIDMQVVSMAGNLKAGFRFHYIQNLKDQFKIRDVNHKIDHLYTGVVIEKIEDYRYNSITVYEIQYVVVVNLSVFIENLGVNVGINIGVILFCVHLYT